jgi:hypothetical protein
MKAITAIVLVDITSPRHAKISVKWSNHSQLLLDLSFELLRFRLAHLSHSLDLLRTHSDPSHHLDLVAPAICITQNVSVASSHLLPHLTPQKDLSLTIPLYRPTRDLPITPTSIDLHTDQLAHLMAPIQQLLRQPRRCAYRHRWSAKRDAALPAPGQLVPLVVVHRGEHLGELESTVAGGEGPSEDLRTDGVKLFSAWLGDGGETGTLGSGQFGFDRWLDLIGDAGVGGGGRGLLLSGGGGLGSASCNSGWSGFGGWLG